MKRWAGWFAGLASLGLLAGCVERRYVITSDPPGAIVLENGRPIGATPVDGSFVYYGTYHFTLVRDGHETLQVDQPISTPWYEIAPLDFVTENLIPWRIRDVRRFHYQLPPLQTVRSDQVLDRGQQLRQRAAGIGQPPSPPPQSQPEPPALPQLQPPIPPPDPPGLP
jgi:hypothetical protein